EDLILDIRRHLREHSDLGFYGAAAILDELARRHVEPLPSARTVNRILERRGAFDGRRRARRPPPPPGWYLPDLAARRAELDSFDIIEGLVIKGGPDIEVLTGVSLYGGLPTAGPRDASVTAPFVAERLAGHGREFAAAAAAQ